VECKLNFNSPFKYLKNHSGSIVIFIASILVGVWALQGTIALRNLLITAGSLFGLFFLLRNRTLLITRSAIPIIIFFTIFLWVTFHFIFLVNDYSIQLHELTSLWARVLGGACNFFNIHSSFSTRNKGNF
jgi:hypothetical protein